jgi:hypothetical protein
MPLFIVWLQKRSVEYGAARQKPFGQSASTRHGLQKLPSPRQTPARGTHTLNEGGTQVSSPTAALQSVSTAHSGVHAPAWQC